MLPINSLDWHSIVIEKFICMTSILNQYTMWKVSKYGVISGPYFPVFGRNTVICEVNLCI